MDSPDSILSARKSISIALLSETPSIAISDLNESGAIEKHIPSLFDEIGCFQNNRYHMQSVWDHTMRALDAYARTERFDLVTLWAILLHDIGKVPTKITDLEGFDHFYGHESISESMSKDVLEYLGFDGKFIGSVSWIVGMHKITHDSKRIRRKWIRFLSYGSQYDIDMMEINHARLKDMQIADSESHINIEDGALGKIERSYSILEGLLERPHRISDVSIDEHMMVESGLYPHPHAIDMMKRYILNHMMTTDRYGEDAQIRFMLGNIKAVNDIVESNII